MLNIFEHSLGYGFMAWLWLQFDCGISENKINRIGDTNYGYRRNG